RAGRHAEAARIFEGARDFRSAADLYRKAGRTEDAARVFMKAGDPVSAARLYYDKSNHDACIKALQKVLPGHRDFRAASFLLGRIFFDQGLHTLAVDKFTSAIGDEAVGGDNVDIYYSMALAHEANRRPREALAVYQKILSFDYSFKDAMPRMKALEEKPRVGPARGRSRPPEAEAGRAEAYRY